MASEEAILDRDLFLNLGQVQNLSLDLSEHLAIPEPPVVFLNGDADQEIIGMDCIFVAFRFVAKSDKF